MGVWYDVRVRNELTGEVTTVSLQSNCWEEAQVAALVKLFKSQGWRKAVALQPELAALSRAS
jgi:hypothetical protein